MFSSHPVLELCYFQLGVSNVQKLLQDSIKQDAAVVDIFYAFFALKNLNLKGR